jgi:nitrite reductase (NADH) large subunit
VYKKLVIKDNKLVGGVMYGDTADGPWYFQLLKDGRDIHDIRDHLIFGQNAGRRRRSCRQQQGRLDG